jgi:hypothetical protein
MLERLNKLTGWQRLGISLSLLWFLCIGGFGSIELLKFYKGSSSGFFIRNYDPVMKEYTNLSHQGIIELESIRSETRKLEGSTYKSSEFITARFFHSKFLSFLLLPVFILWIFSFIFLRTYFWIKAGFKSKN